MKTYIVLTSKGFVATMAENKKDAAIKVSEKLQDRKVYKSSVTISACHIDYVSCEKIK